MATAAERYEVVQFVGFHISLYAELSKGDDVMHVEGLTKKKFKLPAMTAHVIVSCSCFIGLFVPVWATVINGSALPAVRVFTRKVIGLPLGITRMATEFTGLRQELNKGFVALQTMPCLALAVLLFGWFANAPDVVTRFRTVFSFDVPTLSKLIATRFADVYFERNGLSWRGQYKMLISARLRTILGYPILAGVTGKHLSATKANVGLLVRLTVNIPTVLRTETGFVGRIAIVSLATLLASASDRLSAAIVAVVVFASFVNGLPSSFAGEVAKVVSALSGFTCFALKDIAALCADYLNLVSAHKKTSCRMAVSTCV